MYETTFTAASKLADLTAAASCAQSTDGKHRHVAVDN